MIDASAAAAVAGGLVEGAASMASACGDDGEVVPVARGLVEGTITLTLLVCDDGEAASVDGVAGARGDSLASPVRGIGPASASAAAAAAVASAATAAVDAVSRTGASDVS